MSTTITHSINKDFYYQLPAEEIEFLKGQTGITDDAALEEHVFSVATRAFDLTQYRCIRDLLFLTMGIRTLPSYQDLLELGKIRDGAILLDIGCCFGYDVRKVAADGFPVHHIVASDLLPELWDFGHELFKSAPSSFPVAFIPGNVFDLPTDQDSESTVTNSDDETSVLALTSLTSLSPLRGRVSAIHASRLFHLFEEEKQAQLARRLAALLSPLPGSMIFGRHRGAAEPIEYWSPLLKTTLFNHSPGSWTKLWDGDIFPQGTVTVECGLRARDGMDGEDMWWSVTRL